MAATSATFSFGTRAASKVVELPTKIWRSGDMANSKAQSTTTTSTQRRLLLLLILHDHNNSHDDDDDDDGDDDDDYAYCYNGH